MKLTFLFFTLLCSIVLIQCQTEEAPAKTEEVVETVTTVETVTITAPTTPVTPVNPNELTASELELYNKFRLKRAEDKLQRKLAKENAKYPGQEPSLKLESTVVLTTEEQALYDKFSVHCQTLRLARKQNEILAKAKPQVVVVEEKVTVEEVVVVKEQKKTKRTKARKESKTRKETEE